MRPIDADKIEYFNDDYGFETAYKVDIDNLPTLTPPNEWVSVEDSIPCSGKRVLATDGSFVGEAWYASLSRSWYRYNGLEWNRICREVTHWMPLPKSPKEDE